MFYAHPPGPGMEAVVVAIVDGPPADSFAAVHGLARQCGRRGYLEMTCVMNG